MRMDVVLMRIQTMRMDVVHRQFYDRRHGAGGRMREIAPVLMKAGLVGEGV